MTKAQLRTLDKLEARGYKITVTRLPLGRGALLVSTPGYWIDHLDLTVNTDGSYHQATDEAELAA
jgi:hypothetical protein